MSLNSPTKAPQQTEGQNAQFGRCGALVGELRDKLAPLRGETGGGTFLWDPLGGIPSRSCSDKVLCPHIWAKGCVELG